MLVSLRQIVKTFPGVTALDRVDFDLRPGEVHALLGENGAGKSTLIKIIAGVFAPDGGQVLINGQEVHEFTPHRAQERGVGTVYQGLSLVPQLTVVQNLFLGHEEVRPQRLGWLDRGAMRGRALDVLERVGLEADPDTPVERLPVSQQQLVEIARVLLRGASIFIMDEPTDKLTSREADRLFGLLRTMRGGGHGVVYITHKLEEIPQVADRVTVLRDGRGVATETAQGLSLARLVQLMVGRDIEEMFPKVEVVPGAEILCVEHLTVPGVLEDVTMTVRAGEIVGIAGLVGSGRSELAKALIGAIPVPRGIITVDGRRIPAGDPEAAVRAGLALLPEDRHREGLFLYLPVRENITIPSQRRPWLDFRTMESVAGRFVERLRIRTPSLQSPVMQLSGGNQQKVVLSKWLASRSRVFIFDEPTQGIDVSSKVEIYRLIGELAESGAGIILISSEMREILALSDRVIVMWRGKIMQTLARKDATPERILASLFGDTAA